MANPAGPDVAFGVTLLTAAVALAAVAASNNLERTRLAGLASDVPGNTFACLTRAG